MPKQTPPHDHSPNFMAATTVADPGLFGNGNDMDVEVPLKSSQRVSRKRVRNEPEDEDLRIKEEAKGDFKELENYLASIGSLTRADLIDECKFLYECLQDMRKKNDPDYVYQSWSSEEDFYITDVHPDLIK